MACWQQGILQQSYFAEAGGKKHHGTFSSSSNADFFLVEKPNTIK